MGLAELIRRRPGPFCRLEGPARMPRVWAEGTSAEVSVQLAVTQRAATVLLTLAWDLVVKLPRTSAALRSGILDQGKASVVATWCGPLDTGQARAAEDLLFSQNPDLGSMTWTMVRDRVARAVLSIDPDAARRRRQDGERDACVETGLEQSGNMRISARELPPASALALDQKLTCRARELKKAGIAGSLARLRVLAYLERWGIADPFTQPETGDGQAGPDGGNGPGGPDDESGPGGNGSPGDGHGPGGPGGGPGGEGGGPGGNGTAGWLHLTVPASTIFGQDGRAGQLSRLGAVDADLARNLADTIARNRHSTICVTAADPDGRPVAHACAHPARGDPARKRKADPADGRDPDPPGTGPPRERRSHGLEASASGQPGQMPGDRTTWRLRYAGRELDLDFAFLAGPCDHRYQSPGHDPGKYLKHLTAVLHQDCTFSTCRTPEHRTDYEHAIAWPQARTCLCNGHPCCRRNHRNKQEPGWHVHGTGQPGYFTWSLPSGRTYTSKPTSYPC